MVLQLENITPDDIDPAPLFVEGLGRLDRRARARSGHPKTLRHVLSLMRRTRRHRLGAPLSAMIDGNRRSGDAWQ